MVKHHRHGAVGHVKHGQGEILAPRAREDLPHARERDAEADQGREPAHVGQPQPVRLQPAAPTLQLSAPVPLPQPHSTKRQRRDGAVKCNIESLLAVLDDETVDCAASREDVQGGCSYALSLRPTQMGRSQLHLAVVELLASSNMTSLDLTNNSLDHEFCLALAAELREPSCRLVSLNLKWAGVGPEVAKSFAEALGCNQSLSRLNVERNGLAWSGGRAFGEALLLNKSLVSLDVSLNDIGPVGGCALGEALKTNGTLTELAMVRCGLGPQGGLALGQALEMNSGLTRLDVTQNDFGVSGAVAIGQALHSNCTLRALNMRGNRIGYGLERSTRAFCEGLAANRALEWLDLAQNELGASGGTTLARALHVNRVLKHLDLERNELGVSGAALAEALAASAALTSVNLSQNELGSAGSSFAAAIGAGSPLRTIDLSRNELGPSEGEALGEALQGSKCECLILKGNHISGGAVKIAAAIHESSSLTLLDLSENRLGSAGGVAFGMALKENRSLVTLGLARNGLEDVTLLAEAIATHPQLREVDLSFNSISLIPIAAQRALGLKDELAVDLVDNPLSSPPLGRRATPAELRMYLTLLASEPAAVSRIRLMTLGFGGVGKSTFCAAGTRELAQLRYFQASLKPLQEWDAAMLASWARCLGTDWCESAAAVLQSNAVGGKDVDRLVVRVGGGAVDEVGEYRPSKHLKDLAGCSMSEPVQKKFAQALGALAFKGYFSTVGAVKVEGVIPLRSADGCQRECSLVDFAGQMEYLVSHQLLLTTMHALCIVIKPATAFASPDDPYSMSRRHPESWRYWLRYLRALSKRSAGSLLLAVSHLDRVSGEKATLAERAFREEFTRLQCESGDSLGGEPVLLDYSVPKVESSMVTVRKRLSQAADAVAQDWWVPQSYERLAELVRCMLEEKRKARELPILGKEQLRQWLLADGTVTLRAMADDPLMMKRAIEYLEAVGDVMTDERLDVLLLDPVGWFAAFLAHFIRDDGNRPAEVVRGVVSLADIITALRHDYSSPEDQVPKVMSLVCKLELCLPHDEAEPDKPAYLFPCLLPSMSEEDLSVHWWQGNNSEQMAVVRGHRFRAASGFLPPGLFPGLIARLMRLNGRLPRGDPADCVRASRLWSDAAVLVFRSARVLLCVDLAAATLDIVAAAPSEEHHFVGAAKGQASVTRWLAHLVRRFLTTYEQIDFEEAWLCPSTQCHGLDIKASPARRYTGAEFSLVALKGKPRRGDHFCDREGCWHQLGTGHKLEPMRLRDGDKQVCSRCSKEANFELRAGAQFGWGSCSDAQQMMRGLGIVMGGCPGSQWRTFV